MMELEKIKSKIITIQGQQAILDSNVAELYGVETKRVNEAVSNNPDKFPNGYILYLDVEEWGNEAVSKVEAPRHSRKSGNLLPIVNN